MAKDYRRKQYGLGDNTEGAPAGFSSNTGMRNTGRSRAASYTESGGAKTNGRMISPEKAMEHANNVLSTGKAMRKLGSSHPDYPAAKEAHEYSMALLDARSPRVAHFARAIVGLEAQHEEARKNKQDTRHLDGLLKVARQGLKDVALPPERAKATKRIDAPPEQKTPYARDYGFFPPEPKKKPTKDSK